MELFLKDFVLELNTKNMGNSPRFLTITHTTLSARRFRSYEILMIDVATEFYIQTEQWHNGSSISSLRLAKTLEVPNTVLEANSQVSDGPLDGTKLLAVYELRQSETRPVVASIFLAGYTFLYKIGFWRNFVMTSPKTSYMKAVTNELRFLLITPTT
jgi:hypothetical protein